MNTVFRNSIRINMPETNSSSCHSITIFGSPDTGRGDIDKKYFTITKEPDDTLIIPGGESFDRSVKDVKDVMGKIQYACTGVFYYWDNSIIDQERKAMLENVLKDYLAVDFIEYHWDNPEEIENWGEKNPDELFDKCPNIVYHCEPNQLDHDSFDKHDEIFENEDTLRNFIFSSLSVAACGEDGVTEPSELYEALRELGNPLVLRYKADNISIYYDSNKENNLSEAIDFFDLAFLGEFPFVKDHVDIFPKIEPGVSPYFEPFDWGWNDNKDKNEHNFKFFKELGLRNNSLITDILSYVYLSKNKNNWNMCIGETEDPLNMAPILLRESLKYPFPLYFFEIDWLKDKENIKKLCSDYDFSEIEIKATMPPNINYIKVIPEILFKGNILNGENI